MSDYDLLPCKQCGWPAGVLLHGDKLFGRCRPCGIDYKSSKAWNADNAERANKAQKED